MKKTILLSEIIFLAITGINAQTYSTAVGAKFYAGDGSVGGLNIRHTLTPNTAVEGSLLFFSGGLGWSWRRGEGGVVGRAVGGKCLPGVG